MTCIINSTQSLVLATAMVVSSTVLFLAFSKQKNDSKEPQEETLRSCLYSGMIRRAGFESQTSLFVEFFFRKENFMIILLNFVLLFCKFFCRGEEEGEEEEEGAICGECEGHSGERRGVQERVQQEIYKTI